MQEEEKPESMLFLSLLCEDSEKVATHKPGGELSPGMEPCQHLDLRLPRLQNLEKINVSCLSHPV